MTGTGCKGQPAAWPQGLGWAASLPAILLLCGCGGAQFGEVSGQVLLGGKPLAGGTLEFQPAGGSPSYGKTDEEGRYRLLYSAEQTGAEVGLHTVRISGYNERVSRRMKEPVPARFNAQSELQREVKPGAQTFDFDLPAE